MHLVLLYKTENVEKYRNNFSKVTPYSATMFNGNAPKIIYKFTVKIKYTPVFV